MIYLIDLCVRPSCSPPLCGIVEGTHSRVRNQLVRSFSPAEVSLCPVAYS